MIPLSKLMIAPSGNCRVFTIFTIALINVLLTRDISFPSDSRVSARVGARLLGHEPVIVPPASCEGELLTFSCLLVIKPPGMVSKTSSFGLGLAANWNLRPWPTQ